MNKPHLVLDGVKRPARRVRVVTPVRPVKARAVQTAAPTPQPVVAPLRRNRRLPAYYLAALGIVGVVAFFVASQGNDSPHSPTIKKVAAQVAPDIQAGPDSMDTSKVKAAVDATIAKYPAETIGVSVIDIASDKRVDSGVVKPFTAASTTKVIAAVAFMKQVEAGKASLKNRLGQGTAEYQLRLMLNQSDNDSWALINQLVGAAKIEQYAHSWGLNSYDYDANTITAADDATLLKLLYSGKLLTKNDTSLLLSFMQDTNNEDLIPAGLPSGTTVYHKYGQLDGYLHDTGIVGYQNRTYVLAIYTQASMTGKYAQRAFVIQDLTKAIMAALPAAN